MKLYVAGNRVCIQAAGLELVCSTMQFQQLEPGFTCLPNVYEEWSPERHYIIEDGNQSGAPDSLTDRALYVGRISQYLEALKPPEPPPEPEPEPQPDWQGFAAWRYQQPAYLELVDSHPGRVALFEGAIARGEYASAIAILQSVAATGVVPPELAEALAQAARQFNLPEQLIQALLEVLNA